MKKKNGFTLIELLAVIVILAIIALIAVPVILNIIDKANKSAFKDTAYGIVSAGELYFAEQQLDLNGMETDKEFDLSSQVNTDDGLQLKGEVPTGTVKVSTDGKVAMAVNNGRYCITKGFDDTDVELSEDIEHCYVPQTLAALSVEDVECATDKTEGACGVGTLFTLKVNGTDTKDFRVMNDEGEKVTLIMSENLGNQVAWYDGGLDTSHGPITAINYLDELTDDEWSNVPKKVYTYSGLADNGARWYEDITRTMRARMITYSEVNTIKTNNNGSIPTYMDGRAGGMYWTSTAFSSSQTCTVGEDRDLVCGYRVDYASNGSVRPVIELSK